MRRFIPCYTSVWIAVLYFALGVFGLQLAIPPGFASGVWPAAGLAVATILIYGKPAMVGIFAGSFFVNLYAAGIGSELSLQHLLIPLGIATGAIAHASIANILIKRWNRDQLELMTQKEIFRFYILSGPIACLASALIGTLVLISNSAISFSQLSSSFMTWWIGDSIGVIVVAPIALSLLQRNSNLWKQRRTTFNIPVLAVSLFVLTFFYFARGWEEARVLKAFEDRVSRIQKRLNDNIYLYKNLLMHVDAYIASLGTNTFNAQKFEKFLSVAFKDREAMRAISWNPLVKHGDMASFSRKIQREGKLDFKIFSKNQAGEKIVPTSKEHFPVLYITPLEQNKAAIGYDVYSNPIRRAAIEKAKQTRQATSTERLVLVQAKNKSNGYLVFYPNFIGDELLGFSVGVFESDLFLTNSIKAIDMDSEGLSIALYEVDNNQEKSFLYREMTFDDDFIQDTPKKNGALVKTVTLDFFGRLWHLNVAQLTNYNIATQDWVVWSVLAAGLAMCSLLGIFLLIISGREYSHKALAADLEVSRKELANTNENLESQVLERTKKLQEASEVKSMFVANMSHEIRTPLNGIVGITGLLKKTDLNQEQIEYVETLDRSSKILREIVTDILDFSKIESGNVELEEVEFNLVQHLEEILKPHVYAAQKKGIFLEKAFPRSMNLVWGDSGRISQIINNLVSNSIKFTKNGGVSISLKIKENDQNYSCDFFIHDTGVGIPAESKDKMFKAFSQADGSVSRSYGGTGLGLSICSKLVSLMNGTISFDSAPNGTTFQVHLDLKKGRDSTATNVLSSQQEDPTQTASKFSGRVLVAEDNPINQLVITRILQKIECEHLVVSNGNEVLDALREGPFDLILMDCQMPEMDGYTATKTIRRSPTLKADIPIIALTANATKDEHEKCLEVGMNDFLSKPIEINELFLAMSRHLKIRDI